jgi:hypothetical protein
MRPIISIVIGRIDVKSDKKFVINSINNCFDIGLAHMMKPEKVENFTLFIDTCQISAWNFPFTVKYNQLLPYKTLGEIITNVAKYYTDYMGICLVVNPSTSLMLLWKLVECTSIIIL